jgi:hypothetical protein
MGQEIDRILLTRANLRDFATGASDIDVLCDVARAGTRVLSLARLHAKVYVVDDVAALVTSANATTNGMYHNWECGVALTDPATVRQLSDLVLRGFGAYGAPIPWSVEDLEQLREPVRILRTSIPPIEEVIARGETDAVPLTVVRAEQSRFVGEFTGWLQLTLEGIVSQPHEIFMLDDLDAICKPLAKARYPQNRNVRPKLRQQLQRLRDLGLVEFLGAGRYRRLIDLPN